jgi:hypothetical protein
MDRYPDSDASRRLTEITEKINDDDRHQAKGSLQFFIGGLLNSKC